MELILGLVALGALVLMGYAFFGNASMAEEKKLRVTPVVPPGSTGWSGGVHDPEWNEGYVALVNIADEMLPIAPKKAAKKPAKKAATKAVTTKKSVPKKAAPKKTSRRS